MLFSSSLSLFFLLFYVFCIFNFWGSTKNGNTQRNIKDTTQTPRSRGPFGTARRTKSPNRTVAIPLLSLVPRGLRPRGKGLPFAFFFLPFLYVTGDLPGAPGKALLPVYLLNNICEKLFYKYSNILYPTNQYTKTEKQTKF